MILFLNDTFLEKEFLESSKDNFIKSCNSLFEICSEIKNKKLQYSSQSINLKCCRTVVETFFIAINNKDLEVLFLKSLQNINVKYWDEGGEIQDDEYNYYFFNTSINPPASEDINNTTLAEAAKVVSRGDNCVLAINLPDLLFSAHFKLCVNIISKINITEITPIFINCTDSSDGVKFWIESELNEKFKYLDFSRTPIDDETCLINKLKFKKINGLKVQGRQVYQDNLDRFWYVDNEHKGGSAHIEVYDKNKRFIGESDLKGNIDFSKKNPGRTF